MKQFLHKTILIGFLFLMACKSTEKMEQPAFKQLPTSYKGSNDSINISMLSWKQFFNDSDLIALLDVAVRNNPDAFIAMQKIKAAEARVNLWSNKLLPDLNAVASGSKQKFGLYTMDGAGNASTEILPGQTVPINLPDYYLGLQTSWEIDIWGKLKNRKRGAVARYLSTIEGKNLVITNLVASIAMTYYELLALDFQLDIIKETIKLQENALKIVKIQKQSAQANDLAVRQFEAQLLNSKSLEIEILQQITESENLINFYCGRFPQMVVRNKNTFMNSLPQQIQTGIPSDLLRNRPDVRQAELEMIASKADVKAAKAAFYPSLTISGGIGFQAFKPDLLFTSPQSAIYNILGTLVAPLINRSAIKAEFKAANALQISTMYNYQKAIINAYIDVYNEIVRIDNLQKIYNYKSQEVDVFTKAIESSSVLFKTGNASYLEVLMTHKNVLVSRLELVTARKKQYQSVISIYKALGGGWR